MHDVKEVKDARTYFYVFAYLPLALLFCVTYDSSSLAFIFNRSPIHVQLARISLILYMHVGVTLPDQRHIPHLDTFHAMFDECLVTFLTRHSPTAN